MGSSNSTRRITVVNDEASGVIKISDSVVHRLRGEWDTQTASKTSSKSGGGGDAPPPNGPQTASPRKGPSSSVTSTTTGTSSPSGGSKGSEVLKISRHERDEDVKRVENYWRDKLRETERRSDELHQQTVNEFNRGLMEVESLFVRPSCGVVCQDHQSKVKKCYEDNLEKSLNCSKEVKAFTDCVEGLRLKTVTKG